MVKLIIEIKILIFTEKTLSPVRDAPSSTIAQFDKIQKEFIWSNGSPKLKHAIPCSDYEKDGFENENILSRVIRLQSLWVKRIYNNNNCHIWKAIIPLNSIKNYLSQDFLFHSC